MKMQFDMNRCSLLFSTGDLKGLKKYVSVLNRHKSWVGSGGLSPLHLAAWHNQVEMCEFLLEEGMTPSVTEPFTSKTPLHFAAYLGHIEIAKTLKKFGADLLAQDFLCCSPIHYAAMGKHKDMIIFFLRNGLKTSIQSCFGSVLDILIRKKGVELVDFFSNVNGVESLDVAYFWDHTPSRSIDHGEWTPFHSAAVSGQVEIFNMLLEKFPFVPEVAEPKLSIDLETAVSSVDLALLEGYTSISKRLGFKRDVNEYRKAFVKKNWYETGFPKRKDLCDAIRYRNIEKLDELIRTQGVNIIFQREGKTWKERLSQDLEKPNALDFASLMNSLQFFDFLIEKGIEIPEAEFSIYERQKDLFFNWALMEVHPLGEEFLRRIGKGKCYEQNLA